MTRPPYFFVFDVESVGLHGQGFAVGWVVIDVEAHAEVENGLVWCPIYAALDGARDADIEWVTQNVLPSLSSEKLPHKAHPVDGPVAVCQRFWSTWKHWRELGALLAADVPWPVEARFLNDCVLFNDARGDGPYPLIDVASVRLAKGLDPLATEHRLPTELPAHNPRADARQSARLLMEALAL